MFSAHHVFCCVKKVLLQTEFASSLKHKDNGTNQAFHTYFER